MFRITAQQPEELFVIFGFRLNHFSIFDSPNTMENVEFRRPTNKEIFRFNFLYGI